MSLLAQAAAGFFSIPLCCRIHESVIYDDTDKNRTQLDKLVRMALDIGINVPAMIVADAYYASAKVILPLLSAGWHLVSSARMNAVAYLPPPQRAKRKGRPRVYGDKIKLRDLFADEAKFLEASSPIYGERDVTLRYHVVDLLWRPVAGTIRFVLVIHPTRGKKILLCTDVSLAPIVANGLATKRVSPKQRSNNHEDNDHSDGDGAGAGGRGTRLDQRAERQLERSRHLGRERAG